MFAAECAVNKARSVRNIVPCSGTSPTHAREKEKLEVEVEVEEGGGILFPWQTWQESGGGGSGSLGASPSLCK